MDSMVCAIALASDRFWASSLTVTFDQDVIRSYRTNGREHGAELPTAAAEGGVVICAYS